MAARLVNILELGDFRGTLKDFKLKIDKLVETYGENSTIYFDAGYNNVDVVVIAKKEKSNEKL